ncbi:MAG: M23 family metallopeptidase [Eubacteriales bacterium]|nr:M23 family metallopeptidase [Eubacteriales bacterium]
MKRYTYQKNQKSRREKIGFFTAFSICAVAIGLALCATFMSIGTSVGDTEATYVATMPYETQLVNNPLTVVVTETEGQTTTVTEPVTTVVQSDPAEPYTGESDSLQTMLQVTKSLDYPIDGSQISKEYSEEAIYSLTMGDYRSHLGVDFLGDSGQDVCAMGDGVIEKVYEDEMLGNVVVVRDGNFAVYYCGLSENVFCVEGNQIARGDVIGTIGVVPCEAQDLSHVHVEVRVGEKTIDPLAVISSNR